MRLKIITMLMCVVLLNFSGCTKQSSADIAFAKVAQKTHSAVIPKAQKAKWAQKWWMPRHVAIKQRVSKGNVDMVFIGDSITYALGRQKNIWPRRYASRNAVNLGFSGDYTQHVLWRLENGEIDGISPKLAVVMIGTNNSNRSDYIAEEIADGIIAVCAKLRSKLPKTKILLLAIFPRGHKPGPQRQKVAQASRIASQIADGKMIHYLDIGSVFLSKDGMIGKDVMYDYLHLTEKGCMLWAKAIEPKIVELTGMKMPEASMK